MQVALKILGYENPYHFSSMYGNIKDVDMWLEALQAKYHGVGTFGRAEFDKLLGHVAAVTDAPCTIFGVELMEAYPEAKVVLVERDIEKWYKSWGMWPILSQDSLADESTVFCLGNHY